jgi:predicted metal-dependent hydrolase
MRPDFVHLFTEGVERFNSRRFWDAHESWEELWLDAGSDLDQFLQGLIQIAAAYHHVQRGTIRGAVRLFDAGLRRLEPFPRPHCGIDREDVERAARTHRELTAAALASESAAPKLAEGDYPRLRLLAAEESPMPPSDDW